ncbi:MAG TPA: HD-GYP domain-containing protein [Sedimenticola sp.]|nr:HD-GYP domain-containing protein [Sedimenticola sp.]
MIKKIPTSRLRVGMYIYDLNCDWASHPFALNDFQITSQGQIREIMKIGIEAVYIDTDRGLDVEDTAAGSPPDDAGERPPEYETKPLIEELAAAANVRKKAIGMMSRIMEDVRAGKPVEMEQITPAVENMARSILRNTDASVGLTRIKRVDKYTAEHCVNVSILMMAFHKSLSLDDDELVQTGISGLLQDIGKARIPEYILNKPGGLTPKETAAVRRHVKYGLEILKKTPGISAVSLRTVAEHHERFDGSGYPAKMRGDLISLYGQMAAISDVYDALTADRAYKKGIPPHAAMIELLQTGQHNSALVQKFIHCIGIYPVGSLVALSNGCFAVVIESNSDNLLHPRVKIIFDSIKRQYLPPEVVDLSSPDKKEDLTIISAIDAKKWHIRPEEFLEHARYFP